MHTEAYNAVAARVPVPAPDVVVEFGSKNINGSVRPLFPSAYYLGVDCVAGPDVDFVADAATFRPVDAPDCVVCCEVLEHAENARQIITNALRILAPGGTVIITCASVGRTPHSAVDGGGLRDGEFYQNVTALELHTWLEEAGAVDVSVEHDRLRGDVYAVGRKAGS